MRKAYKSLNKDWAFFFLFKFFKIIFSYMRKSNPYLLYRFIIKV